MPEETNKVQEDLSIPENEFEKYLLESLVKKGLSGTELVEKFNEAKRNVGWTIFGPTDEDKSK